MRRFPHFKNEARLWRKNYCVIGVDEVGRGSFAGPLVVAAVCFEPLSKEERKTWALAGINDSKKLKPTERMRLAKLIRKNFNCSIASISVNKINKQGIARSTQEAMRKAIGQLVNDLHGAQIFVLSDAFFIKYVKKVGLKNQRAIIHGDQISIAIAAASIVAKVERDKMMKSLSRKFPSYLWGRNKGYGTKKHQQAIIESGLTEHHRINFVTKLMREVI